jgi:hypothetical protein
MNDDFPFHIEILAPYGLKGIESHLSACRLPLEAWISGFNGKIVLRLAEDNDMIEFDMPTSIHDTIHASGYLSYSFEQSFSLLLSLSHVLTSARFPHWIGMDVGESVFTVSFGCNLLSGRRWASDQSNKHK